MIDKILARLVAFIFERMNRYDTWLEDLPENEDD